MLWSLYNPTMYVKLIGSEGKGGEERETRGRGKGGGGRIK